MSRYKKNSSYKKKDKASAPTKASSNIKKREIDKPFNRDRQKRTFSGVTKGLTAGIYLKSRILSPQEGNQSFFTVAFTGVLLLLFYPPFFRGLFFPVEQRWTMLFAVLLFFIAYMWKLSGRRTAFLNHPLDYFMAAMVMVYILAAIQPASKGLAVAETAKAIIFFLVYWLVSRLGDFRRNLLFFHSLYLAATGVALAALLSATDIIYIKDGFVNGRFFSTLQYPNALASYVGAVCILGFYLWAVSNERHKYFYAAANYLLLMVFLGTGSRGAYLVIPFMLLLFCILTPREYRKAIFLHLVVTSAAALLGNARFIPFVLENTYAAAWGWFLLGLLVALFGQSAFQLYKTGIPAFKLRTAVTTVLILLVVGGGLYTAKYLTAAQVSAGEQDAGFFNRVLSPQVLARIQDINIETTSSRLRLDWTRDAIKMVMQRPVLGFGGGGWEAAYRQYQSYYYSSTQVHNHYAQVAVETGLTGIAVLSIIWILFLFVSWRNYRRLPEEQRFQALALCIAALAIGVHAVIDFSLALAAISIMLYALFGMARNLEDKYMTGEMPLKPQDYNSKKTAYITVVALASLAMFLFAASYLMGYASARQAAAALQQNDYNMTVHYLKEASLYDPFTASYNNDLAGIYLKAGNLVEAKEQALMAKNKDPFNIHVLNRMAEIYWQEDSPEETVAIMEQARRVAPWLGSSWENLAQAYTAAGISYLSQGEKEKARNMFDKAAKIPGEAVSKINSLGDKIKLHQKGGLELTPALQLRAAIGQYFLGQTRDALDKLTITANNESTSAEAQLWLAVIAYNQGNTDKAEQLLEELIEKDTDINKQFEALINLPVIQ